MAARKRRKVRRAVGLSLRRGRKAGYSLGFEHGHWYGLCESAMLRALPIPIPRPLHVLCVTSGKGYPYSPLDKGIQESLKTVVTRMTLADPTQDIPQIAASLRPDLVLVLDGMNLSTDKVQAVGKMGIRTAVWMFDDPYHLDICTGFAPSYGNVFTIERNCVPYYTDIGCARVFHLPMGVFPDDFRPRNPPIAARGDFCFVGTAFWKRVNLFQEALPRVDRRTFTISGMFWDRLPDFARWSSRIDLNSWMDPGQTSEKYNANRLVVNVHRDYDETTQNRTIIPPVSPNPRTFEISATGAMQLTDWREDIGEFYVPGREIVVYDSADDLANKIDYYLEREGERKSVALRGLYRTMRDHTYVSRLNRLLDCVFS